MKDNKNILHCGNRLATGLSRDTGTPCKVEGLTNGKIVQISCGDNHSLAINDNGNIFSWGANNVGQLGHGTKKFMKSLKKIEFFSSMKIVAIAAGSNFSLCVTSGGNVYSWGANYGGVLGHGDTSNKYTPKLIEALAGEKIDKISAGDYHCVAVQTISEKESCFFSWGWNGLGQLGLYDTKDRDIPTKSKFSVRGKVLDIKCGAAHTALLSRVLKLGENCLYMWGSNKCGQIGVPITKAISFFTQPISVPLTFKPLKIALGANHTVVVSQNNKVFSSGSNLYSQTVPEKKSIVRKDSIKSRTTNLSKKSLMNIVPPMMFSEEFTELTYFSGKVISEVACGGSFTVVTTKKEWIDDNAVDTCMGNFGKDCKKKFGVLNRRHHCRNCGGIFCGVCSFRSTINNVNEIVRVCKNCHTTIEAGIVKK